MLMLIKLKNLFACTEASILVVVGAAHDVTDMIRKYGIVPEEAYAGLNYGEPKHDHAELDAALKAYIKAIADDANKNLP